MFGIRKRWKHRLFKGREAPVPEDEEFEIEEIYDVTWEIYEAFSGDDNAAKYKVGRRYEYGIDVEKSNEEAFEWYLEAAEGGHTDAMLKVAYFYEHGLGVEQSYREALRWYEKAAYGGDP